MTPGARLAAVIDILAAVETDGRPAERILQAYFRARRYAGARDRRAVAADVFEILRTRARLGWWLRHTGAEARSRSLALAHLALMGRLDGPAIERQFTDGTHAPGALDGEERALAEALGGHALDHPDMPGWARHEHPPWLEPQLRLGLGADFGAELDALNRPAPLDLRVNTLLATREVAQTALAADGIACEPTPLSPWGLRSAAGQAVDRSNAYMQGLVEIQDEASQIAVLLARIQPAQTVVDYCAGAGGKTLAIAAVLQGQGRLIALDTDPHRLERMVPRLGRARAQGVETAVLLERPAGPVPAPVEPGTADRVLVDAPCSGTGTWRRDPGLKWRLTPDMLAGHVARQRRIVARAAGLVRPGGLLIYMTCSVLPQENEEILQTFIADNPAFAALPAGDIWTLAAPCPSAVDSNVVRLTPRRTATDGFSIAVLRRNGA
jgi:16S rRNA (cytosine967-C5)-methyltransferase